MNRLRTLAIAAAPAALLIGLASPAPAAPGPQAPTMSAASCYRPGADQVLTAQEGIELANACKTQRAPSWHWMGNYGSVYDVVNVANSKGVGPGELVTIPNPSGGGLIPTFMYY
ncbi:hypothetical protein [Streptomyces sp. NBC_01353]|uniref:hypothetical protein n=1 Tax=Streptomyces sp. NBC_01353 TaxID=2903835 RepID=UPI002E3709EB|nr:hypothetical protein [Streptomyces sp. NBC_01353]